MNLSSRGVIVVKIGGSTLGSQDTTVEDLVALQRAGRPVVVVHGGGKTITQWLEDRNVATKFVRGLRVTDAESLKVVVAVLAGLVNKELVAAINSLGGQALGLSGADGRIIEARVKDRELGYVGEVVKVNIEPLATLLGAGYMPIIAPVGIDAPAESGEGGYLLNINADTVAGEIAAALPAERLVFLTDVPGICDSAGKLVSCLSPAEAKGLIASGIIYGGMIPKVEACLRALANIPVAQIVDGRLPHALLAGVKGSEGTRIE